MSAQCTTRHALMGSESTALANATSPTLHRTFCIINLHAVDDEAVPGRSEGVQLDGRTCAGGYIHCEQSGNGATQRVA